MNTTPEQRKRLKELCEALPDSDSIRLSENSAEAICEHSRRWRRFNGEAPKIIPALLADVDAMPQWHDRPTVPGLWVIDHPHNESGMVLTLVIDQKAIDEGIQFGKCRVYGPIPAAPKEVPARTAQGDST